jgi:hypothetical protein
VRRARRVSRPDRAERAAGWSRRGCLNSFDQAAETKRPDDDEENSSEVSR